MLKSNWRIISAIERICDNLILLLAFFLAYEFRDEFVIAFDAFARFMNLASVLEPKKFIQLGEISNYFIIFLVSLPIYNVSLTVMGAYKSMRYVKLRTLLFLSFIVFITLLPSNATALFLLKLPLSRSFVMFFCLIASVLFFVQRFAVLRILRFFRARGKNFRNLLIVGTGEKAKKIAQEIELMPELGVRVVGFINTLGESVEHEVDEEKILGDETFFEPCLKKNNIDEVLFTGVLLDLTKVENLAEIAAEEGVKVTFAIDFFSLKILQTGISYLGSSPLIHYQSTPENEFSLILKRVFDFGIATISLVLLSPLFLIIALVIKLESKGNILFKQKRVGLNGRVFTLYKFRSMVDGAEKLATKLQRKNEMSGPVFKIKNDPRITKFGKFLRKYSLDELPQLFNVFRGDMSLVGPRPPLPDEVNKYERFQRRRLSMRPGLTCIWQVRGRNNIPDFETWAKLDLEYIDNWTLMGDFILLVQTIPVVLKGSGAH